MTGATDVPTGFGGGTFGSAALASTCAAHTDSPKWVENRLARCILTFDSPTLEDSGPPVWDLRKDPEACRALLGLATGDGDESARAVPERLIDDLIAFGFLIPDEAPPCRPDAPAAVERRGKRLHVNPRAPLRFEITAAKSDRFPSTRMQLLQYGGAVLRFLAAGTELGHTEKEVRFLKRAGLLVPPSKNKSLDALLGVAVDEDLLRLVPPRHQAEIQRIATDPNGLMLHRGLILQEGDAIPFRIRDKIHDHDWMRRNLPHLWIEDRPGTAVYPYWLDEPRRQLLDDLIAQNVKPRELERTDLEILCGIQALVPSGFHEERERRWGKMLEQASRDLAENECAVLCDMVAPVQLAMFRRYARILQEQKLVCHDVQYGTSERYWLPDDPVSSNVQRQTAELLNRFVPDKVQPGYCLLTTHLPGAELRKHQDQNRMCNYAFSLLVDMIADEGREPWPLYSWTLDDRRVRMDMGLGDGGLFRPLNFHGREGKLDHSSSLMLFSFVPIGYRGFVNGHRFGL